MVIIAPPTEHLQHRSQKVNRVVSFVCSKHADGFMSFKAVFLKFHYVSEAPRELVKTDCWSPSRVLRYEAVLGICISNTLPGNDDATGQGYPLRPMMYNTRKVFTVAHKALS